MNTHRLQSNEIPARYASTQIAARQPGLSKAGDRFDAELFALEPEDIHLEYLI